MATTIVVQGGEFEVADSYNKVRQRLNKAAKKKVDFENGNIDGVTKKKGDDQKYEPFTDLSFSLDEGGRVAINPEKVIGVMSDLDSDRDADDDE